MRTRLGRKGQGSVEYLLLLCSLLVVINVVGLTIQRFGRDITERVVERALDAAFALAAP
jgi:hypothetical protein